MLTVLSLMQTHTQLTQQDSGDDALSDGHMCGELSGIKRAVGWHHPQHSNDWVTSSRWLHRLPSRCIADCLLTQPPLRDYCTYSALSTALTRENPTQSSQAARRIRLYYLCNLNPINSKPTQSSSARRGTEKEEDGCTVCVWERRQQWKYLGTRNKEKNKSHHLSGDFFFFLRILLPLLWHSTIALFSEKGEAVRLTFICWIHNSQTVRQNGKEENPSFLYLISFFTHAGSAAYQGITPHSVPGKWKQRHVFVQDFFSPFFSSSVDTKTWPSHADTE